MDFTEMKARAEQIRSRDLYGLATEEELAQWPAKQTELWIDTDNGERVHIYQIMPERLSAEAPVILNFHGGGFIKGRQSKDQLFCSRLALECGCMVWDVDYSLSPEAPFPKALNECYGVTVYVEKQAEKLGIDRKQIFLTGHSAGGNLAAGVCMKLGETNGFRPAGLAIEFFPADLYTDPALKDRVEHDMPAEVAKTYNAFYCSPERAKDPYVSPLFAEEKQLKCFPETLILSAGLDSLSFEDEDFALKLARAGVPVTCRRFCESRHGFTTNRTDEWEAGMEQFERFLKGLM